MDYARIRQRRGGGQSVRYGSKVANHNETPIDPETIIVIGELKESGSHIKGLCECWDFSQCFSQFWSIAHHYIL